MNNRLKDVRKSLPQKTSQEEFGKILGITRTAYAKYEAGLVVPSDTFIQLLCSKFNIDEHWLRTGEGSMKVETDETIVESLKQKYNMTDNQKKLMDIFLSMSSEKREQVAQAFFNFVDEAQQFSTADQAVEPAQKKTSTDIKRAIVNSELDAESKGKIS